MNPLLVRLPIAIISIFPSDIQQTYPITHHPLTVLSRAASYNPIQSIPHQQHPRPHILNSPISPPMLALSSIPGTSIPPNIPSCPKAFWY
jgi:hypothetical protein